MTHHSQSGNALWFILIAIVLLGGLTVMMSRTSSTSEDSGDYERGQIEMTELMRYAKSLELGISQMQGRGCSENEISFWHDSNGDKAETVADTYYNSKSPADHSCHVFDARGAGLNYRTPSTSWLELSESAQTGFGQFYFTGISSVKGLGTTVNDASTTDKELLIIVPYMRADQCKAINNQVGILNDNSGGPPLDNTGGVATALGSPYKGTFTAGNMLDSEGSGAGDAIDGHATGCVRGVVGGATHYIFYHALIAR